MQVTTAEVSGQTRCQFLELRRVSTAVTLRTRSWWTSTRIAPQHATPDVPIIRMTNFWPHASTCWFLALEAQFKVHRIDRRYLLYAEEIAISASDVILGPMSNTPHADLKMAILHQTSRAKYPTYTKKAYTVPALTDRVEVSDAMFSTIRVISFVVFHKTLAS